MREVGPTTDPEHAPSEVPLERPPDRWPIVRRSLLVVAGVAAAAVALAGVLTGRGLFLAAAWTFASLPIAHLLGAAVRRSGVNPVSAAASAAAVVVLLGGATVIAISRCEPRIAPGADLAECDLSGVDLSGVDLSGANLSDANLSGALVARTSFRGTDLDGANLRGLDLRTADLAGVSLERASLEDASLQGAALVRVSMKGARLEGANLTGANLGEANLSDVSLEGVMLDRASLIGVTGLPDESLAQALRVPPTELAGALIDRAIRLELREEILRGAGPACSGDAVRGVGAFVGGFHPMVILDDTGVAGVETDEAATLGWEPTALRFVQLVACVQPQTPVQLEACPYAGTDIFGTITRYRYERSFKVVEASTGRVVLDRKLEGTLPDPCPLRHVFLEGQPTESFYGSSVPFGDVQPELEKLVG